MRAFHTIAVPHKDILEGRLSLDTFAADLWEVYQNRGIDEYRDADTFFKKTYLTQGLQNLIDIVEKRLQGKGSDPVIQIQTPFGGGKTHALIALYHSAKRWGANVVVIDGTALSAETTFWALMEEQLTGKVSAFSQNTSPGKDKIRAFLEHQQPVLLLMDEVLEYTTKAAGMKVGDSNLASQTIAFMQELTEVASTLPQVCLVATLPSSIIEHYDNAAEDLYQKLQKVSGRKEIIYTPVEDNEITKIIRRRLFSNIDEQAAKDIVDQFVSFAEEHSILPAGVQPSQYREKFMESYPFLPDVVDTLYHRWGSFPTFQRTRGVLRLLSLVIYSMKETTSPYLTLADFELGNQEIRQELIKHIGQQYNGIISQDITNYASGAVKVNKTLGNAFMGLCLGERAAKAIFLFSFSGAGGRGSTLTEIKRNSTTLDNPPSVIAEALEQFKRQLLYLHERNDMYFFSTEITLNKLLLISMENVKEDKIQERESLLLQSSLDRGKLEVYLWNEGSGIPDTDSLKLIILDSSSAYKKKDILSKRGQTQRIYKNTLFFLIPMDSEYPAVSKDIRENIALNNIESDPTLKLSTEQKREIKDKLKVSNDNLKTSIRKLYRLLYVPSKGGELTEIDLGIPLYGSVSKLNEEVYDTLRKKNEILENITPILIREKYLSKNDYALTEQIYYSAYRTPGEARPINRSVLEKGISDGVQKGLFGLGAIDENDLPLCAYFKEPASISLSGKEVIIKDSICTEQKGKNESEDAPTPDSGKGGQSTITPPVSPVDTTDDGGEGPEPPMHAVTKKKTVQLTLNLSKGQSSTLSHVLRYLSDKFQDVTIEIKAKDGEITESDYENKIKEAFEQSSIDYAES